MLEHVAANVGHHPFAQPVHRVEARRTRQGEDDADADQRSEIFVDEIGLDAGEAEIDHAPDGKRHDKRGPCRDDQRNKRGGEHPPVA